MQKNRNCPICDTTNAQAKTYVAENIDTKKLSSFSFASRKDPEYMSYRMVICPTCGLVYAVAPPSQAELARAYHVADYDSSEEASDAAAAYLHTITPILEGLPQKKSVLEIGAGTGVFLELLAAQGFGYLVGVEPSVEAIAAAPLSRRSWIREGIFNEGDFEPGTFDLICCFMTMEHVRDPKEIAEAAFRLLRPGGAFVTVTHDYRGLVNRILGNRSPIIDIEHMQLFSRRSNKYLFQQAGYSEISVRTFKNCYALSYWFRLLPLPKKLKARVTAAATSSRLGQIKLSINVGNLMTAGIRPEGN